MTPPPSPQLPRSRFNYGAYCRFGTVTLPVQSHRENTPLGHSFGFDSSRRYAFSEVPRLTHPHASTSAHGSFRHRSLRQVAGQQPMFAQVSFQGGGECDSGWNHNQTILKQDVPMVQAASRNMMLGATQPEEGLSWLTLMRREGREIQRLNSYPPSVVSMELDMGRQVEADSPIQQIQAQKVTTL